MYKIYTIGDIVHSFPTDSQSERWDTYHQKNTTIPHKYEYTKHRHTGSIQYTHTPHQIESKKTTKQRKKKINNLSRDYLNKKKTHCVPHIL